ncbi:protein-L-isoaspartate(D-aspartate) O-methyltransferase [Hyphomonas sp.]|uniref:protein-L-isoaspartate O-methyltransferase family protein n=1 Tax=Hyphomonas sp. TaxID=87 RepID=UPI000C6ABC4F|nr:protein-L-isoaspartate(D-aspartate) O-methyltransferase [Hyphomonas sp.]MAU65344.1 protein-L-isoaspartate(D-aspartate) O-methyltransferase [Hyphomonas sp.]MBM59124.1 protein-L-isoaspartate(D-aspartate) O-methyltransferase [Hyphomonas sp.]
MAGLIADPFRAARLVLHLRQEGVTDDGVLRAMETIDRAAFIDDPALTDLAFENALVPIPCGQIIPRPVTTGQLIQALQLEKGNKSRVLLVGAGSGYTSALLAQIASDVFAVERFNALTGEIRRRILDLELSNLAVRCGDGLLGWPERGPYDRILLAGAVEEIPEALRSQLAKGGLLVAPVVTPDGQVLMRLHENGERERLGFRHALPLLREGPAQAL